MKFPGTIIGIDRKTGDEHQNEDTLVELTDAQKNGTVELRVTDRNEDFYVRFRLQDLVTAAMDHGRDTE